MARDSGGNYSLPPGYLAVTGQKVLASQHNGPLEDVASALTGSLPRNGSAPMGANLPMAGFKVTGLGAGTASGDAATKGQVDAATPTGTVADFAGASAPSGWLLCYGQAISRTTYAALFTVIGATFGNGNGSTTFNVPDCRGRVSAGKDNMGGTSANRLTGLSGGVNGDVLGGVGGAEAHTLTVAQMPAHTHGVTGSTDASGDHTHSTLGSGFASGGAAGVTGGSSALVSGTGAAGNHTHTVTGTAASAGSGTAHNNVQPVIIFNKIIKTGL